MEEAINKFIDECCTEERGAICRATKLYDTFGGWWDRNTEVPIPSRKRFFSMVRRRYLMVKVAGAVNFRELRVNLAGPGG